jgi:predicted nucleotidyltransferase
MTGPTGADFQPDEVLRLLNRHRVRYVLIGGLAAILHGSPSVTRDIDICHARGRENLLRLTEALREVNAHLRGAPAGLAFKLDAETLANGDSFTFATDVGSLDILAAPAGTRGYDDLVQTSETVSAFGEEFAVASLDDLIRMKRAAGRPKDRVELEILGALREEIDDRRSG